MVRSSSCCPSGPQLHTRCVKRADFFSVISWIDILCSSRKDSRNHTKNHERKTGNKMNFPRASGILLHPTSLPGPFGIGDLGPQAYAFADFLAASGQSLWQVLPLGPTGYGDSPYACYSAFAGNTLLISPERLFEEGLLAKIDLDEIPSLSTERVDFGRVHQSRDIILDKAFAYYQRANDTELRSAFQTFVEQNASWLDDYALFRALKNAHGGQAWHEWDRSLVGREPAALARARADLRDQIEAQKFFQFLFFKQWFALKAFCNE